MKTRRLLLTLPIVVTAVAIGVTRAHADSGTDAATDAATISDAADAGDGGDAGKGEDFNCGSAAAHAGSSLGAGCC